MTCNVVLCIQMMYWFFWTSVGRIRVNIWSGAASINKPCLHWVNNPVFRTKRFKITLKLCFWSRFCEAVFVRLDFGIHCQIPVSQVNVLHCRNPRPDGIFERRARRAPRHRTHSDHILAVSNCEPQDGERLDSVIRNSRFASDTTFKSQRCGLWIHLDATFRSQRYWLWIHSTFDATSNRESISTSD